MTSNSKTKINQLLTLQPSGVVLLTTWLVKKGYPLNLLNYYRDSQWLESIGYGAMIRSSDKASLKGAIHALQNQLGLSIHPGGKTALSMLGKTHYLEFASKKVTIFGGKSESLPSWFRKYNWEAKLDYHASSFLPPTLGLMQTDDENFQIKVSSPTRALMECIYLAPKKQELFECYELMEGLNNLNPKHVQKLLEQCSSVKVNRVFLYLAQKAGHRWFDFIKVDNIKLGKGKRSLVHNGIYIPEYKITVPKELADYDH